MPLYNNTSLSNTLDPKVLIVKKSPGPNEFLTIESALNSIIDNSSSNPYKIVVNAGIFIENSLIMKPYVCIEGSGIDTTFIVSSNTNQHLIIADKHSYIKSCTLGGSTDTGYAAVYYSVPGYTFDDLFTIDDCNFSDSYYLVYVNADTTPNVINIINCTLGTADFYIGFNIIGTNGGIAKALIRNCNLFCDPNLSINTVINVDGEDTEAVVISTLMYSINSSITAINGTNGALLRLNGVNINGFNTGILMDGGTNNSISAIGINFENCVNHLIINDSTSFGYVQGSVAISKSVINNDSQVYIENKYRNTITVSKINGDYTTIEAATASITDSSNTKPYVIYVTTGIYDENTITVPPYTSIIGSSINTTIIQPIGNNNLFNMGLNTEVSFCSVRNVPVGYIAFNCVDTGNFTQYHKLSIYDCDTAFYFEASTLDSQAYLEYIDINGTCINGIKAISNGFTMSVNCENFYLYDCICDDAIFVQGPLVDLSILAGALYGVSGNAITIVDGAALDMYTIKIRNFDIGINNPNTGVGSLINIRSAEFDNIIDLNLLHNNADVTFNGSLNKDNITINPLSKFNGLITDHVNNTTVTIGNMFYGKTTENIFDFSTLLLENGTMGVFSGGQISVNSGLTIDVAAGFGYLEDVILDVKRIDWLLTSLLLPADEANYIYVNSNGILSYNSIYPSSEYNIILGRVVTNSTDIEIINNTRFNAHHYSNDLDKLARNGLGAIYSSGSIVTENATPLKLDVTGGIYYFASNEFLPIGGTAINFLEYINTPGGFTQSTTDTVNNTQYNNGTSLTSLSTNYFTSHSLYVSGDGATELYLLVFGQDEYISQLLAETSSLPTPPNFFSNGITLIASIIVQEGNPNIVSILDKRPIMGSNSVAISGTLEHGNLLGLADDDHLQYIRVDGTRSFTGNVDLGGNNITNIGTINSITLASHASRHVPNGADPLPTAAPVTIGTTNAEGINNTFSRSDHVHAHGVQSDGTLHSAVTVSTNGFMLASDKIKLNSISSNASVSSVGLSLPSIFTVSNSPVTGSGTLTGVFNTQLTNLIFAAPNGSTGVPTFRLLAEADIPTLSQSKITNLTSDLSGKEPSITLGTTGQYWRGDKTFQTLDKTAVGLSNVDNVQQYPNTNPNGYETPSQLNTRDTNNRNRANHTGTQLAATISDFQSTVSANTDVISNTAKVSALKMKSGVKAAGTFVGTPRKATVTFATAFADANYSISIIGANGRTFTVESVAAGSFIINTGANGALTGNVYWTAIKHGEN